MKSLNEKILLSVILCIFTLPAIFYCYNLHKYPYADSLECRNAETQLGIFSNVAFRYYLLNDEEFKEFIESSKMPCKIDVWGNQCLLKKDKDKVLLRSFGKNGIDDNGKVDDITVIIEQRKDGLFKTKKIAGYTKFKYWKIFPKSWNKYGYSYDDDKTEEEIP
jgi:hypothetical protein